MKSKLFILPLTLICVVALSAIASGATKDDWDSAAARRKADYMFIEAQNAYSQEDYGRYITLVKRAFDLDSADLDIAAEWAVVTLSDNNADTLTPRAARAYEYLKRKFLSSPDNYQFGSMYASVARNYGLYDDAVRAWEILDSIFPQRDETAMRLASAYLLAYQNGDSTLMDKALSIYNRLESGTGKNIRLSSAKIVAYFLNGDTTAIRTEIRDLMDSAPGDSYTAYFAGNASKYLNNNDEALSYYDLACRLDSTNGEAFLAKAELYRDRGDSVAFDREVFHALRSINLDVDTKLNILGSYIRELYSDSTQEPRIRELFGELEQVNAGEPDIHGLYGAYLYEINDLPGAVEQFSYAVALDPSDESNWVSLVQTAGLAKDSAAILEYGIEAIEKFPDNFIFPIYVADTYRKSDRMDLARAIVDSVKITEYRNYRAVSQFLTFKGDIHAASGDTIGAIELYDRAIELNPDNAMAYNNAAYFMAENNIDLDKAEKYSALSLKDDALNPTYLDTYAWVFYKKKDFKMALHYIDMAIKAFRDSGDEADNAQGETDDETEAVEEVQDGYEPSADVYDHAGDIYFMNGEPAEALKFWKKALEYEPDNELIQRKVKYKTIFFK